MKNTSETALKYSENDSEIRNAVAWEYSVSMPVGKRCQSGKSYFSLIMRNSFIR